MERKKRLSFVIANDHTDQNNRIAKSIDEFLKAQNHCSKIINQARGPEDDFPIISGTAVELVRNGNYDYAILISGNGGGVAMVANKFIYPAGTIRAAVINNADRAKTVAANDKPNVLCLPAWELDPERAQHIIRIFLQTKPSTDPKHIRRRKEILDIEHSMLLLMLRDLRNCGKITINDLTLNDYIRKLKN